MMLVVKNLPASAGDSRDVDSILGSGRFPGVETGNLLQYSSLENSMDREACWAYSLWVHKEADTTELLSATKKTTHPHLQRQSYSSFPPPADLAPSCKDPCDYIQLTQVSQGRRKEVPI